LNGHGLHAKHLKLNLYYSGLKSHTASCRYWWVQYGAEQLQWWM